MKLIRYQDSTARVGATDGTLYWNLPATSIADLLQLRRQALTEMVERVTAGDSDGEFAQLRLLPPIDGHTEVWASGVTYKRSRAARMEESHDSDIYARVYAAHRPELFLKAPSWRVIGDGDPVGMRSDSALNVPEPELGLVINAHSELVGLVTCNDMSSRTLEGENPLYLPQAKIYDNSCVLSNAIVLTSHTPPIDREITLEIRRSGEPVFTGSTNTMEMARTFEDLSTWLTDHITFPHGVILSTGTGIVPPLEFVLEEGDEIRIWIEGVGQLHNTVTTIRPRELTTA